MLLQRIRDSLTKENKLKHELDVEPFDIPATVRLKGENGAYLPFPIEKLSKKTLDELCDQFVADVKAKALRS